MTVDTPVPDRSAFAFGRLLVPLAAVCALLHYVCVTWFPLLGPRGHYVFYVPDYAFDALLIATLAGFVVHYWAPPSAREPIWLGLSIAMAFVVLGPFTAAIVLGLTALVYAICAAPIAFAYRAMGVIALMAVVLALGHWHRSLFSSCPYLVVAFGAVFMLRIWIYLRALKRMKTRPGFLAYVRYFCVMPNYVFPNFPMLDYDLMSRGRRRDRHAIAQDGVVRMAIAAVELAVFRYAALRFPHLMDYDQPLTRAAAHTLPELGLLIVLCSIFYLRIAGSFALVTGIMMLFGYDLPPPQRLYGLATSPLDYWRRANVYWKEGLELLVFRPVTFALRKRLPAAGPYLGVIAVFVATAALHDWVLAWLTDGYRMATTTSAHLYWVIVGLACLAELALDLRKRKRARVVHPLVVRALSWSARWLLTFCFFGLMWVFERARSTQDFFDLLANLKGAR